MKDYIEIPLMVGALGLIAWGITKFGGLLRFSRGWHCLMGAVAVVTAIVSSYTVFGFRGSYVMAAGFMLWLFLWMLLAAKYLRNRRGKDVCLLLSYPVMWLAIVWSSKPITVPRIEEARRRGDALVQRLVKYQGVHGGYPSSLAKLVAFDGVNIPETGVGFWDPQGFRYSCSRRSNDMILSFTGFGGPRHYLEPGTGWWIDD